jgi:hypothetical protein
LAPKTQPRAVRIDNVQSDAGVAADLLSCLLSHGAEHCTYRSPADRQFERLLLGSQSSLTSAQRFVHTPFCVNIVDRHCSPCGLVPKVLVLLGDRYQRVTRNQVGGAKRQLRHSLSRIRATDCTILLALKIRFHGQPSYNTADGCGRSRRPPHFRYDKFDAASTRHAGTASYLASLAR